MFRAQYFHHRADWMETNQHSLTHICHQRYHCGVLFIFHRHTLEYREAAGESTPPPPFDTSLISCFMRWATEMMLPLKGSAL